MKTKQCLVIVMTLLCLCVKAQNLRVTGVVRDKSDVIIGASVMVKKSIHHWRALPLNNAHPYLSPYPLLSFSYIGYTPVEKQVDGQTD